LIYPPRAWDACLRTTRERGADMSNLPDAPPPGLFLLQALMGKFVSKALSVAADLGVADHMQEQPTPVEELARQVGAEAGALYRLLRGLAAAGFFVEGPGRSFALTPVSRLLRSDLPESLRAMARWINEESSWRAWGQLEYSVRTGKPSFDEVHGAQAFDYFARHPRSGQIFNEAMSGFTAMTGHAVAEAYDFSGIRQLVDVGGNLGALLSSVIARFPTVQGTLFDLPEVVKTAPAALEHFPHKNRIELVAGSFFEGVPKGADAYIMKAIIHDWSDEDCVRILRNCREAMEEGGRVLIVEQIITDKPEAVASKLLDLEMLVMTHGGRERTEAEFTALLTAAGFRLSRIVPTRSPVAVIEAVPA
jgi:hypothetical protein